MTILIKYRIYCTVENVWTEGWRSDSQGEPIQCFTNTEHTVNANSVQIVETINTIESIVRIKEEYSIAGEQDTNGQFCCEAFEMVIPANSTVIKSIAWQYPISVLEPFFMAISTHDGNILNSISGPNTIVGTLTENVATNATIFDVSPTVIQYAIIGFQLLLNGNVIGCISNIDSVNSRITVTGGATTNYSSGAYVGIQKHNIKNYKFRGSNCRVSFGSSKIGGSYLKKNIVTQVIYQNLTNDEKTFNFEVEYLY